MRYSRMSTDSAERLRASVKGSSVFQGTGIEDNIQLSVALSKMDKVFDFLDPRERAKIQIQNILNTLSDRDIQIVKGIFNDGKTIHSLGKSMGFSDARMQAEFVRVLAVLKTAVNTDYDSDKLAKTFPDCVICANRRHRVGINAYLHLWYEVNDGSLRGAVKSMPSKWYKVSSVLLTRPRIVEQHVAEHLGLKKRSNVKQRKRLHFDATDIVVTVPLSGDMRSSIKRVSDSYAVSQSDILRGSIILGLPLLIGLFEQKALLHKFVAALGLDLLTDYVGKVHERK